MDLSARIKAFSRLGKFIREFVEHYNQKQELTDSRHQWLEEQMNQALDKNPWFTIPHILEALGSMGEYLTAENLNQWTGQYPDLPRELPSPKKVGVVPAGNIPLVGFHDFLSVLITGNIYYAKLSSKDPILPKAMASLLHETEPRFGEQILFEDQRLSNFDAIIATGSNNTSRYFEYYFGPYPHIIRKNRNGVAVLTGKETPAEMQRLAKDVLLYFGLGCRNVSKLYLPEKYDMNGLLDQFKDYERITDNSKYGNNYDYNKSVFLINQVPHYDTGFLLVKRDQRIPSPISTLHYETYHSLEEVKRSIEWSHNQIQCVVSHCEELPGAIPFGQAQYPHLWDYADGIDTLRFLVSLNQGEV
ncbi:MAG: hypothetical protein KGY60_07355 [Bacteroidales bacterium]|nr:hypothetical protein [Bacteroidales bacterium]